MPKKYRVEFFEHGDIQTEMPNFMNVMAESRRDAMKVFWAEIRRIRPDASRRDLIIISCVHESNR